MTREEALTKLLALSPLRFDEARAITGWPEDDLRVALGSLMHQQVVGYRPDGCGHREYVLRPDVDNPFGQRTGRVAAALVVDHRDYAAPHLVPIVVRDLPVPQPTKGDTQ